MDFLPGKLYVVATPIGNLEDITKRALTCLTQSNIIFCEDTRVTRKLLDKYTIVQNKRLFVYNKDVEAEFQHKFVLSKIKDPSNIVSLVTDAGTPCISDPGSKLLEFLIKNEVEIDFLPGPCALINGVVLSGFDFANFTFLGFIPKEVECKKEFFEHVLDLQLISMKFKSNSHVFIFYETAKRLQNTLAVMLTILGNQNLCIAKELTKLHQTTFRGKIKDFLDLNIRGEVVLILKFEDGFNQVSTKNDIESEIIKLLNNKLSINDISRIINVDFGISKNKAYKLVCLTMKKLNEN